MWALCFQAICAAVKIDVKSDGCFVFTAFSILCTANTARDMKDVPSCMTPFFFNYLQAWIWYACARLLIWVWASLPAGGSTPLALLVQVLKTTELTHEETSACHCFPPNYKRFSRTVDNTAALEFVSKDRQSAAEERLDLGTSGRIWCNVRWMRKEEKRERCSCWEGQDRLKLRLFYPKFMTYSGDTGWRYFG